MAYGVEQQIGIGAAQVLPQGPSHMPLAQQLYRQKQDREEKERQEKKDRDLDEYNRIKIVGDALDPRNFNQLIHTKVRDATAELAAKLKDKPSLADTYLMAQQHAGKLGHMSDQFNQLQQTLSKTRDEYKFDKRLDTNAIAEEALKNALHDFNTKGEVDLTKNYYDEALNDRHDIALTDKSDYTVVDFKNARKQDLFGKYTDINKAGRTDKYDWKTEYYPDLYDFKDNGEAKEPTMTTKAQPSGLKDENNRDVPMLAEEAYGFFKMLPSNVVAINKRLQSKYPDLNLRSEESETLRRIEAYKDVESRKPKINKAIVEKEAPIRYSTTNNINMPGSEANINKVYERMDSKLNTDLAKGFGGTRFNALANDEQDVIKKSVETAGYEVGEGGENVFLKKQSDGKIKVYRVSDDKKLLATPEHEITTLSYIGTNLGKQANVKGKVQTVEKGESGKGITPPPGVSEYKIGGKAYPKSAVEKAAKASGMSIDEYIKAANKR